MKFRVSKGEKSQDIEGDSIEAANNPAVLYIKREIDHGSHEIIAIFAAGTWDKVIPIEETNED